MKGKKIIYPLLLLLAAVRGYTQERLLTPKLADSVRKVERRANMYANRKYSFGVSEVFYCNPGQYHPFWMTELVGTDRLTWLDFLKNASVEAFGGVGFEPYLGTRLRLGFDWELLSSDSKVNLYIGGESALGLRQLTQLSSKAGNWFVKTGYEKYVIPFVGAMWWPGKLRQPGVMPDVERDLAYQHPTFWRLVFFKLQVGYCVLTNSVSVTATGPYDAGTVNAIRINAGSTLNIKAGIGINLPTYSDRRRSKETESMQKVKLLL